MVETNEPPRIVDPEKLTQLVNRAFAEQDRAAQQRALDRVNDELKRIALSELSRGRFEPIWQATAVVNESFLRWCRKPIAFANSKHFFCYAAKTMRRFLVSCERERRAVRRTPPGRRIDLSDLDVESRGLDFGWMELDDALTVLGRTHPELEELVEMKLTRWMTNEQIADALGKPLRTVERHWQKACVLLATVLNDEG